MALTLNLWDLKTLLKSAHMFHHSCWWSSRMDSTSDSSSSDSSSGESCTLNCKRVGWSGFTQYRAVTLVWPEGAPVRALPGL